MRDLMELFDVQFFSPYVIEATSSLPWCFYQLSGIFWEGIDFQKNLISTRNSYIANQRGGSQRFDRGGFP